LMATAARGAVASITTTATAAMSTT
jgi:hypothetical protein